MANPSILQYSFQPNEVFIDTSTDLKIVITNPVTGKLINFIGGPNSDTIEITFPVGNTETDLLKNLNFNTKTPAGIICRKSLFGDEFIIRFTNNSTKLQPGEQLEITFLSVPINSKYKPETPAVIKIKENLENEGTASVSINKHPNNTLDIIAWVSPLTIGLNGSATLYWQSMGGTRVVVAPFNRGDRTFPVEGPPPSPGNTRINIPSSTESQRTYTLTVYTSDQQHTHVSVTLTQNPPLITVFTSDKSVPITVDDSLELDLAFLWGTSSAITSNSGLLLNNPLTGSRVKVNPGEEVANFYSNNFENMPSSIYYQLEVNGFKKMTAKKVIIDLLPVNLLYFKYTRKVGNVLSGIVRSFDCPSWRAHKLEIGPSLAILTLYQPGGVTEVYYLGDGDTTHPQIQYFNFTSKGNGVYELSWVTANLVKLELIPGEVIPADKIKSGTKEVTLDSSTTYVLKGIAQNGAVITSQLNVTI